MNTGLHLAQSNSHAFFKLIANPVKFRLFLLRKLPAAFFSGLKIAEVNNKKCAVVVPYKWFTKNPFRSTYFACHSMAAEMSTGVLAMANVYKRNPGVSMLVVSVEGNFYKKATGLTTFVCTDGEAFEKIIEVAITTGEAKTLRSKSVGHNAVGEVAAEFYITWSFKTKSKKTISLN